MCLVGQSRTRGHITRADVDILSRCRRKGSTGTGFPVSPIRREYFRKSQRGTRSAISSFTDSREPQGTGVVVTSARAPRARALRPREASTKAGCSMWLRSRVHPAITPSAGCRKAVVGGAIDLHYNCSASGVGIRLGCPNWRTPVVSDPPTCPPNSLGARHGAL